MNNSNRRKMAEIRAVANSSDSFEEKKAAVKEIMKYGKTPIIYSQPKSYLRPVPDPGLSTLIENAMSSQEVENLLTKGRLDYKNASGKTRRKWEKAAAKRIAELSNK